MKTTPREAHVTMNTVLNMGAQILTSGTVLYFGVLMDWFESTALQQTMTVVCLEVIVAYYMIAMVLGLILEPKWRLEHKQLAIAKRHKTSLPQIDATGMKTSSEYVRAEGSFN
jgi:hypothetical protein